MEPAKFSFKGFRIVDAELHFDKVAGNLNLQETHSLPNP